MVSHIWFFSKPNGRAVSFSVHNLTNNPQRRNRLLPRPSRRVSAAGRAGVFLLALASFATLVPSARGQSTIFTASAKPSEVDSNDGSAVELGVKFKADTSGYVTGLRFYKASTNTGTHLAHLWSQSGTLLGSATFTTETGSGWQQVNFSKPIAVSANTIYIASYFAPKGHYSDNINAFQKAGVDHAPLHALADGASGFNGVYLYSSKGGFPTNGWEATNYWVDVVFTTAQLPATPKLTLSATSLSFGSIAVKTSATKTLTLTSSGTAPVTVNTVSISGAAFKVVAGTMPVTLNPSQSLTLSLTFTPTASGSASGQLTIGSNSSTGSSAAVSLSGTGAAANPQLTLGAKSLSFGNVTLNTGVTQTLSLTSSGTSAATVSSASITGVGFALIGGSFPMTLQPNQSTSLQVQFKPTAAGAAIGTLAISSNSSSGGAASVALSGTGMSVAHQVNLTWNAPSSSPDPIAGYHIYRSVGSGALQLMNSSIVVQTAYLDTTVTSGTTYDYVVKSVDQNGLESAPSNQIAVTTP
jgi:Domain of unknown function (DUF4082)/Abnormal spindle-like microcephaly-assoc'd, ASPM-SPD-2-Hydin